MSAPTQTERVLSMLRVAGRNGIRSDEFFACGMPRGAARIRDLKDEGIDIESVREGKYTRYRLVGSGAGGHSAEREPVPSPVASASVRSSESVASEAVGSLGGASSFEGQPSVKAPGVTPRSVPSCFDADIPWDDDDADSWWGSAA